MGYRITSHAEWCNSGHPETCHDNLSVPPKGFKILNTATQKS